jgi:hypothetical protein
MQEPLNQLENTYFTLQGQIDMLSAACQTQDQRNALSTQYVQARTNYWACVNKAFHDDDPEVVTLTSQIAAANTALTGDVAQMGDITKVLGDITTVVTIGTQLATKVIGA